MALRDSKLNQYEIPQKVLDDFLKSIPEGATISSGQLQSPNYVKNKSGWKFDAEGNAEFKTIIIGDKNNDYFEHDGDKIVWKATNAELDSDGNLTISGGVIQWSTVAGTTNAPENNATVGAIAGTNLEDSNLSTLEDEDVKNIDTFTAGEAISANKAVRLHTDGKIYLASSLTSDWANKTIGVCPSAISSDSSGRVQLIGYPSMSGLTTGSVYYVPDGTTTTINTTVDLDYSINTGGQNNKLGTTFTTIAGQTKLDYIIVSGKRNGAINNDTIKFELYAVDDDDYPTGSSLGETEELDIDDMSTDFEEIIFRFLTPITGLSASTMYAIVAVTSSTSSSNCMKVEASSSDQVSGSGRLFYNGLLEEWTAYDNDWYLKQGYTTGTIATSAGTITVKAGIALSSSKLKLTNE